MKKNFISTFLILTLLLSVSGLKAQGKYWIFFKDKGADADCRLEQADRFLSDRALQRRARMGIPLDHYDLPVYAPYLEQVAQTGALQLRTSRWLNAVSVVTALSPEEIREQCPSVRDVRRVAAFVQAKAPDTEPLSSPPSPAGTIGLNYGAGRKQVEMLNLHHLHQRSFTGKGMLVAICDAGFYYVDTLKAFDSLRSQGRIKATRDFANSDKGIYRESTHGMAVLSTMAAEIPGKFIGSAPHISVALARTEVVYSETHQEEDNWIAAMEWADSLGVDVLHSSLGYSIFDKEEESYEYLDLDGNTAPITRAADLAASRGILVLNSAGNEGNGNWRYITVPCDGDSVLCVGAVDSSGVRAGFSSIGPAADGRVKPDVMAMGRQAVIIRRGDRVSVGNGTSYAAPIMAGMAACLMQAHPQRSNMDVYYAIQQSADRYERPDSNYGYGVPDALVADSLLSQMDSSDVGPAVQIGRHLKVYPTEMDSVLHIETLNGYRPLRTGYLRKSGKQKWLRELPPSQGKEVMRIDVTDLKKGLYLLNLELEDSRVISVPLRKK